MSFIRPCQSPSLETVRTGILPSVVPSLKGLVVGALSVVDHSRSPSLLRAMLRWKE